MPLKSCLHWPFPFKCLLVWPGPGFRGSHGNLDSELFGRRFWKADPGWRKDWHFCSCYFLLSWGYLRFWQLNELTARSYRRGDWLQRLKSGGFQCGFREACLLPLTYAIISTSHTCTDNITTPMWREGCLHIHWHGSCCKLTCNQLIKYFCYTCFGSTRCVICWIYTMRLKLLYQILD